MFLHVPATGNPKDQWGMKTFCLILTKGMSHIHIAMKNEMGLLGDKTPIVCGTACEAR